MRCYAYDNNNPFGVAWSRLDERLRASWIHTDRETVLVYFDLDRMLSIERVRDGIIRNQSEAMRPAGHRWQVSGKEFQATESGAVLMDDSARKTLLVAWQNRKQEEIRHPFLEDRMPAGLLLHTQALLMARYIRGDLDGYPPFLWK